MPILRVSRAACFFALISSEFYFMQDIEEKRTASVYIKRILTEVQQKEEFERILDLSSEYEDPPLEI